MAGAQNLAFANTQPLPQQAGNDFVSQESALRQAKLKESRDNERETDEPRVQANTPLPLNESMASQGRIIQFQKTQAWDNRDQPETKPEGKLLAFPAQKSKTDANKSDLPTSQGKQINRQKNAADLIAKKMKKRDIIGGAKELAGTAGQEASKAALTSFWGSVWMDWTLLSLLYLNGHLFASLILPKYVCQFGEDNLIGRWIPSKGLAKIIEIILLMTINLIVISILVFIFYVIYKLATLSLWDKVELLFWGPETIF